jgi:hypothetical protein
MTESWKAEGRVSEAWAVADPEIVEIFSAGIAFDMEVGRRDRSKRNLVDVSCQFSVHMANVRIEDGSKILHTCHNKGADVTEFAAQGIWTCFEELCRYFTDRPVSVRERASKRRGEITLRNRIGEVRHFALQRFLT